MAVSYTHLNYVKLRDMGKQVGFNVYWNAGVQIDTGHPYTLSLIHI